MPRVLNVTAAIIEKNGKVLSARRKSSSHLAGYWEFPGGKLEDDETPEECLVRELAEEFGITTSVGEFVGESTYDYGEKIVRLLAYRVDHISGEFQLFDHDELCWLALEELECVEWAPADIPLVQQYKALSSTAAYYEENAQAYCSETIKFDVGELHHPFLATVPKRGHILDLGCGSGRDSKAFLAAGFMVTAIDGSAKVAACAERVIRQPVIVASFQEMDFTNEFDGIWACASLLHCSKAQLAGVLPLIARALKSDGIAYMSFKWGDEETVDEHGRFFSNYTDESLQDLIDKNTDFTVMEIWTDIKPLRDGKQKWVNALVKKTSSLS